jgi:hypothetical protein
MDVLIPWPRSPEDVIHNAMVRQLQDDMANPPVEEAPNPALALLRKVQEAKDRGEPLTGYAEEASKVLQGIDAEEKLTEAVLRHVRVRKIRRQLESDEYLDRFLNRCLRRGDLTPREAVVFKQVNTAELNKLIRDLLDRLEDHEADSFGLPDLEKMDYTLRITEKTTNAYFEKTTPQGREIIRKITLRARRKLYEANIQDQT